MARVQQTYFEHSYPLAGAKHDDRYGYLELEWSTQEVYDRLTFRAPPGK